MPRPSSAAGPRRVRLSAADRRASILAAATEVFSEAGYHGGRAAEVARRVGVSEPVVFQNFGSKAALYAAVLDDAAERVSAMLRDEAAGAPSVGAWLARFLAPEHLTAVHARGTLGVLFSDATTLLTEPDVAAAARRANRRLAATFTGLLTEGQGDGSVRRDVDPAAATWWILSLLASQRFRGAMADTPGELEGSLGELTLRLLSPDAAER